MAQPDIVEVMTTGWAIGGAAVGRDGDGRAVFASGAIAGERVRVAVSRSKRRFAEGDTVEVVEPGPARVAPSCAEVARGCGGCDFAHVAPAEQRRAKEQMVTDALARIGQVDVPAVSWAPLTADRGFRATVRAVPVAGAEPGRIGFRRRRSNDSVAVDSCEVTHPLVEQLLVEGRFPGATEVTIRVGLRTGERMVVVNPTAREVQVPEGVVVVGLDELAAGRRAWIHEEVAGRTFRISARSFFQSRPDGAEALIDAVRGAIDRHSLSPPSLLVDLCAGVGLFAASVAADAVIAVEPNTSAVADARINLSNHPDATIVKAGLARWRPERARVVVADPPRAGLGREGVAAVEGADPELLVLVSCDAGSLGRDAGLLASQGFVLDGLELVDLFPQTSHVEVVSTFVRAPA